MSRVRRFFSWLMLAAVLAGIAFLFKFARVLNNIGGEGGIRSVLDTIRDPRGHFPDKDRLQVLLVGMDYNRLYSHDPRLNGMPYTKNARADTIVVLSLDLAHRRVSALSIPRDTHVIAPDGKEGKINATYSRGGASLLRRTVAQLLGVEPDYVIALKDEAAKVLVDELGGVEVETLDRMKYDDGWGNLHIDLPKGRLRIDGKQAIGYVRFRKVKPGQPTSKEEGDLRRTIRQQQLIRAMVARAKRPENLLRADHLIDVSLQQLKTDLTKAQFIALGALFKGVQPEQIQTATLLGESARLGQLFYFVPDPEKTRHQVDWLLRGDESAANRLTIVAVKNGTQVVGAARRVAEMLRERGGFDADSAGNAAPAEPKTGEIGTTRIIYTKAAVLPRAKQVASLLGGGQMVKQNAPDTTGVESLDQPPPDVTVVLGRDLAPQFAPRSAQR